MNEMVEDYLKNYPVEIQELFQKLRQLVMNNAGGAPEEMMWAKLPSYYKGETWIRLVPFKDHINMEAKAVLAHKDELTDYKLTPKGMLQIYSGQEVPEDVLVKIVEETLW